jgi:hypothetical protein
MSKALAFERALLRCDLTATEQDPLGEGDRQVEQVCQHRGVVAVAALVPPRDGVQGRRRQGRCA